MISDAQTGPQHVIRGLFTALKMWIFLKNTHFSPLKQYKLSNFRLGPIVHPRNHSSISKLDFLFNVHSQILVMKCNDRQKPLWYKRSELTVHHPFPQILVHIVLILRLGYKKMQPKFETAVRMPMKRASKRAPTWYRWPLASRSLWT